VIPLAYGFILGALMPIRKSKPEPEPAPVWTPDEDVPSHIVYRRMQLVKLGFHLDEAKVLAQQVDIVKDAKHVIGRGATIVQAFRILKP
jgi:hypothetical protein